MEHKKETSVGSSKDESKKKEEAEQKPKARRVIIQPEEKAKRGRWITLLILFLSLFFGYVFWRS